MESKESLTKIKEFKSTQSLCEDYQALGVRMAFVTKPIGGEQSMCHQWVVCKDFLHDVARTQLTGTTADIYRFKYEKGINPPIDLSKFRLVVTGEIYSNKDKEKFINAMNNSVAIFNHFERSMKIENTTVKEVSVDNTECAMLFEGSRIWMSSPVLISVATLFVRLGYKNFDLTSEETFKECAKRYANNLFTDNDEDTCDNDCTILADIYDKLHVVLKHRNAIFERNGIYHKLNFDDKVEINAFHNRAGITNFCKSLMHYKNRLNQKLDDPIKYMSYPFPDDVKRFHAIYFGE